MTTSLLDKKTQTSTYTLPLHFLSFLQHPNLILHVAKDEMVTSLLYHTRSAICFYSLFILLLAALMQSMLEIIEVFLSCIFLHIYQLFSFLLNPECAYEYCIIYFTISVLSGIKQVQVYRSHNLNHGDTETQSSHETPFLWPPFTHLLFFFLPTQFNSVLPTLFCWMDSSSKSTQQGSCKLFSYLFPGVFPPPPPPPFACMADTMGLFKMHPSRSSRARMTSSLSIKCGVCFRSMSQSTIVLISSTGLPTHPSAPHSAPQHKHLMTFMIV